MKPEDYFEILTLIGSVCGPHKSFETAWLWIINPQFHVCSLGLLMLIESLESDLCEMRDWLRVMILRSCDVLLFLVNYLMMFWLDTMGLLIWQTHPQNIADVLTHSSYQWFRQLGSIQVTDFKLSKLDFLTNSQFVHTWEVSQSRRHFSQFCVKMFISMIILNILWLMAGTREDNILLSLLLRVLHNNGEMTHTHSHSLLHFLVTQTFHNYHWIYSNDIFIQNPFYEWKWR